MMTAFFQKHWFKLLIAAILIAAVGNLIYKALGGGGEKLPVIKKAADFTLEGADGKQTSFSSEDGKVRLVYFFYSSCPDVCQPTTFELSKVQQELQKEGLLGKDAVIFSVSFDPEKDTVERLKEYSAKFEADPAGWKFLRGNPDTIADLGRQYGVTIIPGNDGMFAHTNVVTLVDREGNIRKYFVATEGDLNYKIVADAVKRLAKEA